MGPIFGDFRKETKNAFAYCGHVFPLLSKIPTPVGSLKCVDFKNVQFFVSMTILSVVNWLRSKNGTIFYQNLIMILANICSI